MPLQDSCSGAYYCSCCRVDVCARETLLSRVLPMIEDSVRSHVVCSVNDACAGVGPSWDTEVRKTVDKSW